MELSFENRHVVAIVVACAIVLHIQTARRKCHGLSY